MNLRSKKTFGESGLTLVEMMVATTLLVVMMLGLTAMFNQTQRAFRGGLKQVDVFEGGRAVMDLVARDLEQLADTASPGITNFFLQHVANDVEQSVPTNLSRTNQLYDLFLMANVNPNWVGVGYAISNAPAPAGQLGVGALYRFEVVTNALDATDLNFAQRFSAAIANAISTKSWSDDFSRVADGVIHFKVRVLDGQGVEIQKDNLLVSFPTKGGAAITNLPHMVEIELGILEPQTLEQARSIADPSAFLQKQAGKVHIFRQQIPIRNAPR